MKKTVIFLCIMLMTVGVLSAEIKGALDNYWFIREKTDSVDGPRIKIDGNIYKTNRDAARMLEIKHYEGRCKYNLITGVLEFLDDDVTYTINFQQHTFFEGTNFEIRVEEVRLENAENGKIRYLIAADNVDQLKSKSEEYVLYQQKIETEAALKAAEEARREAIVARLKGLSTYEVPVVEIKSVSGEKIDVKYYANFGADNFTSRIFVDSMFCYNDLIFRLDTESEDIFILYDYDHVTGRFNLRQYCEKFITWHAQAVKDRIDLNKEIGVLRGGLSWIFGKKRYIDQGYDVTLRFVTKDSQYLLEVVFDEAASVEIPDEMHSMLPMYLKVDEVKKLVAAISDQEIDKAVEKQKEIDKKYR